MSNSYFEFSISRLPKIEFGPGKIALLPELVKSFGNNVLLVTGGSFLQHTSQWQHIKDGFKANSIHILHFSCPGEPGPTLIDDAVKEFTNQSVDVVVGIGGGSALDAAKAIAGLLKVQTSVMNYLEGVGPEWRYEGPSVPFIAVPTTAGTGSEATKNAVLSIIDREKGFKKSFRDEKLVAEIALVDPDFLVYCPQTLIAANGMDALTQLLESYVSLKANPFIDSLALSGLENVFEALPLCFEDVGNNESARAKLAYGAMLSGITLAQVGLGSVHGLASPLGAFFPIPHGEVCGLLLASATQKNVEVLREFDKDHPVLKKYAHIGRMIARQTTLYDMEAQTVLVDTLAKWRKDFNMPKLSDYGVSVSSFDHIIKHCRGSSMKTNPVVLSDPQVREILEACM